MKTLIPLLFIVVTNANANCNPKDLTDPDYLKSMGKENLIEHFKTPRDQDGVGWCGAYAPADSLSFAVGEAISPIDVSINYYASDANKKGIRLENLSGVSPLSATDMARKNGYCPESVIPSNQTSSSNLGHSAISKLMGSFQKIYDDYVANGRPADYCVNCTENYEKVIKPSLPGVTTDMIKDVLQKNQSDSLETFKDLLDKLCEGRRVIADPQVDFIPKSRLGSKTIANVLDEALDNNSMPSIGINTSFFANSSSLPGGHGGHEMMIVARRMNDNGKCEYQVRNSWGRGCSYYQPQIVAKCDPAKGSFWMDQDQLQTAVSDVVVIKNEKNRVIEKPKQDSGFTIFNNGSENTNRNNNDNKDNNSKSPFGPDVDAFIQKATETVTQVAKSLAEAVSSIWKSLSNAFKY